MKIERVKAVKKIVNEYFDVNVDSSIRTSPLIQARAICYKILKDQCNMTYSFIAFCFKKNHATVIHALKEFPWMIKYDKQMDKDYHIIMAKWKGEANLYDDMSPLQLKKELENLHEQNKMLNLSLIDVQERCEELSKNTKKYKSLVDLIEKRVPEQRLAEVEKKINHLINGL
jgi:hypothetical protein